MSRGVRTPDTTSSPCAFTRKSPLGSGAPVISSRENATPVAQSSPLLPNTICCTFTAVPHSSGSRLMRRYSTARGPIQESNTARIACLSWSCGSWGKSSPVWSLKIPLNDSVSALRSPVSSSVSSSTPRSDLRSLIASSKRSPGTPRHTFPNICTKRR